jgi:hypothetical protein
MTTIAFVADVHAANHRKFGGAMEGGLNERCRLTLSSLRVARALAAKDGADRFVVLGDLVDTAKPEPQVLYEVGRALSVVVKRPTIVDVLKGNHDNVSDTIGDHALGALRWLDVAVIETANAEPGPLALIPFQAGMSSEWLPQAWARAVTKDTRVVGVHLGIAGDGTPSFLSASPDAVTVDALEHLARGYPGLHTVVAGNWHQHRSWCSPEGNINVIQCGTFAPAGFDDALPFEQNAYGHVVIVDTEDSSWRSMVVPGPRFEKVVWADDGEVRVRLIEKHAHTHGHAMFVQVTAEPRHIQDARKFMASSSGHIANYSVLPDAATVRAMATDAAASTRSASSVDDAVREYVAKMPLVDDVSRDALVSAVMGYMSVGG